MIHKDCADCDGSCIGSLSCVPGMVVCRACQKEGCVLTLEEFENLSEWCRGKRRQAEEDLVEYERIVFGE